MIIESDNTASDVILRYTGGATTVNRFLSLDPPSDSTTPRAMVEPLVALYQGRLLQPATTNFLIGAMEGTKTFPGRIKGLLPSGTTVAHKTGTGDFATNDVGVITLPNHRGHVALAVYVRNSHLSATQNDVIIARISKAIYDAALR